ncbi:hypothetical protein BDW02DRAFT_758 [Decorospora gaudefroyi]|uniref:Uncharacterized protein n=1 Tax=Decorospora gaudefroyi TaxID=184978 RepID=A0A6A5KXQ4_9PLEO|nr:hypothetical protein BDW02DRAFT_758 [Decorospora gaudefroyi]
MARTRATTKASVQPKPSRRNNPRTTPRTTSKRPSSATSLDFLSDDSESEDSSIHEQGRKLKRSLANPHDHSDDDDSHTESHIKQEDAEIDPAPTSEKPQRNRTKKRAQENPLPAKPPPPKKRKPSPPTTRSNPQKTRHSRMPSSSSSDSDSASNTHQEPPPKATISATKLPAQPPDPLLLPYLSLLRPYLTFQLSLSPLRGPAYTTAQSKLAQVLDVVDQLQTSCAPKPQKDKSQKRGTNSGRSSSKTALKRDMSTLKEGRLGRNENHPKTQTQERIWERKLREAREARECYNDNNNKNKTDAVVEESVCHLHLLDRLRHRNRISHLDPLPRPTQTRLGIVCVLGVHGSAIV